MIGIIGDLHLDSRGPRQLQMSYIAKGQKAALDAAYDDFKKTFVKDVVVLGDVFNDRVLISITAMNFARAWFSSHNDIHWHIIQGNHDSVFGEGSYETSLVILEDIPNVTLYKSSDFVQTIFMEDSYGVSFVMCPWVFPDQMEAFEAKLKEFAKDKAADKDRRVIFGHFDMFGAMRDHRVSDSGIDPNLFLKAAKLTVSGHYHIQTEINPTDKSRIVYTGSLVPLSAISAGEHHGWWMLDKDLSLVFRENDVSPKFEKRYDDEIETWKDEDFSNSFLIVMAASDMSPAEDFVLSETIRKKMPLISIKSSYTRDTDGKETEDIIDEPQEDENGNRISKDEFELVDLFLDAREDMLPKLIGDIDPKTAVKEVLHSFSNDR